MRCNGLLVALFCTGSEMCMCHGVSHHACCMSPIRILGHGMVYFFDSLFKGFYLYLYVDDDVLYTESRVRVESFSFIYKFIIIKINE